MFVSCLTVASGQSRIASAALVLLRAGPESHAHLVLFVEGEVVALSVRVIATGLQALLGAVGVVVCGVDAVGALDALEALGIVLA